MWCGLKTKENKSYVLKTESLCFLKIHSNKDIFLNVAEINKDHISGMEIWWFCLFCQSKELDASNCNHKKTVIAENHFEVCLLWD